MALLLLHLPMNYLQYFSITKKYLASYSKDYHNSLLVFIIRDRPSSIVGRQWKHALDTFLPSIVIPLLNMLSTVQHSYESPSSQYLWAFPIVFLPEKSSLEHCSHLYWLQVYAFYDVVLGKFIVPSLYIHSNQWGFIWDLSDFSNENTGWLVYVIAL